MSHSPLLQLTLARIREFFREPAAIFWVYGFPLLLAITLGTAFRDRAIERIRVDLPAESPDAAAAKTLLEADPRIEATVLPAMEARNRLRTAKTDLVYTPPDGQAAGRYLLDPNRPESVLARNAVDTLRLRAKASLEPTDIEIMTEPGSRYIDFLIPGLLGANLMGGGLFGVGFVVVDMRVRKLLKRYLATPMRKSDFLLSLMLSRLLFTIIEIILLTGAAWLLFDIRIRGNLAAFGLMVLAGGACFAGIGLLVACRAKTMETASGLMNFVMLPMYAVSGVFFSSERFPESSQPFIQALPLTQLNNGLRAVMNNTGGFEDIAMPLLALAAWGVAAFAIALRFFRWR